MEHTRRSILATLAAIPPGLLLAQEASLEPTPACGDDHAEPTLRQTAGPFYKPSSPLRSDLRSEIGRGEPFDLAGYVLDTRCRPIAGAIVEIWHADDRGEYDSAGFRLRGHQRTDEQGRWAFATIRTRDYSNRTAHYHFRVLRPRGAALISQIYFPDHPRNASDRMFDERLVMRVGRNGAAPLGRFDFVLT